MKVKKIMVLCISVLLVCSFVLAGCTKPNDNEKNNGNGSTSAKADVPANRFKAADRTGNNATQPARIIYEYARRKIKSFLCNICL